MAPLDPAPGFLICLTWGLCAPPQVRTFSEHQTPLLSAVPVPDQASSPVHYPKECCLDPEIWTAQHRIRVPPPGDPEGRL